MCGVWGPKSCENGQLLVGMFLYFLPSLPLISLLLWACSNHEKEGAWEHRKSHLALEKLDIIVRCPALVAVASYASVR